MIIAGLTGGIGHGKTTFASLLALQSASSQHFETWELVCEVATALRTDNVQHPLADDIEAINVWLYPLAESISMCVHTVTTFEQYKLTTERLAKHPENYQKLFEYLNTMQANPELANVEITAENKEQFRSLLQWLGGYLVTIVNSGIWYDEIIRRISYLQNSGYDLVTVGGVRYPADAERLRNAGGVILELKRADQPLQDARDITERERVLIHPDSVIDNNGTLDDLQQCASDVYHDLGMRQLKPQYSAVLSITAAS